MKIVDETKIEACSDCVLFIANGDVPEGREDIGEDIEREWPLVASDDTCDAFKAVRGTLRNHIFLGDEELGFSWRECECCGSGLGGDRHEMVVLTVRAMN